MIVDVPADRRVAVKARHRRSILDAAASLIAEGGRFSVEQLAERAEVSRRTVFNHFASIDDVVTTACAEMLGVVIDHFRALVSSAPAADGGRASMFADVTAALRATDVPGTVAFLWRALGGFTAGDPRPEQIFRAVFARTADELTRELVRRNPDQDPLDAELLVSTLVHGTGVIANHWIAATGATLDDEARLLWRTLLDRLIDRTRTGYPS